MSKNKRKSMNIYYFNITYTCNSSCVFCYSHNTIHSGRQHNEINVTEFSAYLNRKHLSSSDRVIINGGEPFLHSHIIEILKSLINYGCEVLIYTNGRCLSGFDFGFMDEKFRFVIPLHGFRELHDRITRVSGSFDEMYDGLVHLSKFPCKVDIKVILNSRMIATGHEFQHTMDALDTLPFNGAVHITKMADTIVSKKNNCPSVTNEEAAPYTALLFEHLRYSGRKTKIFDTCVADIVVNDYTDKNILLRVFFKDAKTEWELKLATPFMECRQTCNMSRYCTSAVGDYIVLVYDKHFYKGTE